MQACDGNVILVVREWSQVHLHVLGPQISQFKWSDKTSIPAETLERTIKRAQEFKNNMSLDTVTRKARRISCDVGPLTSPSDIVDWIETDM
jgi:hypothetical protein